MSTEAHVYMQCHQGAKVKHFEVSNMIYHKFSHGAVSNKLKGENINVMLEFFLFHSAYICYDPLIIMGLSWQNGSNDKP